MRWKQPLPSPFNVSSRHSSDSSFCFRFMPNPQHLSMNCTASQNIPVELHECWFSQYYPVWTLRPWGNNTKELGFWGINLGDWQRDKNDALCLENPKLFAIANSFIPTRTAPSHQASKFSWGSTIYDSVNRGSMCREGLLIENASIRKWNLRVRRSTDDALW